MVERLRAAGKEVEVDLERYPNGRFAGLRDPEETAFSGGSRWVHPEPKLTPPRVEALAPRADAKPLAAAAMPPW
jgi:hypothetical protein